MEGSPVAAASQGPAPLPSQGLHEASAIREGSTWWPLEVAGAIDEKESHWKKNFFFFLGCIGSSLLHTGFL